MKKRQKAGLFRFYAFFWLVFMMPIMLGAAWFAAVTGGGQVGFFMGLPMIVLSLYISARYFYESGKLRAELELLRPKAAVPETPSDQSTHQDRAMELDVRLRTAGRGAERKGSIPAAIGWMFLISFLLFWFPVVGGLIAGFVGGRKAGGLGRALLAVFIPGIVFATLLAAIATALSGFPVIGAIAGAGGFVLAAAHVVPLLFGAILGALTA